MKKTVLITLFVLLVGFSSFANNLVMGTPTISGNTISFNIKWDNSWYVTNGPSNWDAVWIFIKRQACDQANQNPWMHGQLAATGQSVTGSQLQVDLAADRAGVFVRRSAEGIGNITQATVTLTLTTAINTDNIGVYGVEMVNVPEGQFYAGDGRDPGDGLFNFTDGNSNNPLLINQNIQSTGIGAASVYQKQSRGSTADLPATFPLGFNRFYCMKYEITAAQYVAFLNTLTYNQQLRLQENPNNTPPSSAVGSVMHELFGYRIEVKTSGISTTSLTPAVYANDATNDNVFDQEDDGLGLPVSLLIKEFLAFLDWSALRPMTEFEYEKACRGPLNPILGEYAWGTTDLKRYADYNVIDRFKATEVLSGSGLGMANIAANTFYRSGIAATATSDRTYAGATFYGILEMTGSVYERCVGGWNHDYSNFTTINGDGYITSEALTDVIGWPAAAEHLYPRRGGSTLRNEGLQVSDRQWAAFGDGNRVYCTSGRGVRSF